MSLMDINLTLLRDLGINNTFKIQLLGALNP